MTKKEIEEALNAHLAKCGHSIHEQAEIAGEGVFADATVNGLSAGPGRTIVLIGQNKELGGGLKIDRKVLFPQSPTELNEFLDVFFKPTGTPPSDD